MLYITTVKNSLLSSLQTIKDTLFFAEEKVLESIPEPYIPTLQDIADMPEKLREKAVKALHGPDANPTQLGDPVSLKAEQSDLVPKPEELGASPPGPTSPGSGANTAGSGSGGSSSSSRRGPGKLDNGAQGETLREKAMKDLHGSDVNPSMLGDPISLKAEQTDHIPTPEEQGARRRESKL